MPDIDMAQPFPDYVSCPHCGEPEVEVWCYELTVTCHACRHTFSHSLPKECEGVCDDARRARARETVLRPHARCASGVHPAPPI